MLAHYTCYGCGDTWCRDLIDMEVQAHIEQHPELEKRILSGDIDSVDLGEAMCDACEEESALYEIWDKLWEAEPDDLDDDEPSEDSEDEIDRKADLMQHGRL